MPGKGHYELLEAFRSLSHPTQQDIQVEIAGGFERESDEKTFMETIRSMPSIVFHGHVTGETKKQLYHRAHVFCLPTFYPWEGQPFCILEAYAGGCAVITTSHSGIGQVFRHGVNGYEVQKQSTASLKDAIERALEAPTELEKFGLDNLQIATTNYTAKVYVNAILNVFGAFLASKNGRKQIPISQL